MVERKTPNADHITELASVISEISYEELSTDQRALAETCFTDTIGVTLAGAKEEAGEIAATTTQKWADGLGTTDGVSVWGHERKTSLLDAILINATAGHALDYDDISFAAPVHPSVTLVSPIVGVCESEDIEWRRAIAAYVAGFETQSITAAPIRLENYTHGWHSTAIFGTLGAAGAVANLLELSRSETENALAIATSLPAGVIANFGSMTKPLHAGQAARSGTMAALLAKEGFTASKDALTGTNGFYNVYSGAEDPKYDRPPHVGDDWSFTERNVFFKKYPCCGFTHSSIDAARRLSKEHSIDPDTISQITVTLAGNAESSLTHPNPQTELQAKFSLHHTVACAIARDTVGFEAFRDEAITDATIRELREKITMEIDHELAYRDHKSVMEIQTANGETYEFTKELPSGTYGDPLTRSEMREKFVECASQTFERTKAAEVYEQLSTESTENVPLASISI